MSLSFLIILHELGHFIPARIFKTRVEKFFLFFDVKFALFKKKIGETTYGIGWLPLGGYVKISSGLNRKLPPMEDQVDPPIIRQKNIFTVLVSKNDQLLVEEELASNHIWIPLVIPI